MTCSGWLAGGGRLTERCFGKMWADKPVNRLTSVWVRPYDTVLIRENHRNSATTIIVAAWEFTEEEQRRRIEVRSDLGQFAGTFHIFDIKAKPVMPKQPNNDTTGFGDDLFHGWFELRRILDSLNSVIKVEAHSASG